MSDKIPNFKDRTWGEKKELGTATEIVDYIDGGQKRQVEVIANTLSGDTVMAIEAEHTSMDSATLEETLDGDAYINALMCRVFDVDENYLNTIFANKSSNLRSKLIAILNRMCGFDIEDKEVEKQKNSDSPQS